MLDCLGQLGELSGGQGLHGQPEQGWWELGEGSPGRRGTEMGKHTSCAGLDLQAPRDTAAGNQHVSPGDPAGQLGLSVSPLGNDPADGESGLVVRPQPGGFGHHFGAGGPDETVLGHRAPIASARTSSTAGLIGLVRQI